MINKLYEIKFGNISKNFNTYLNTYLNYSMSHKSGLAQNQKKNRVQEGVKLEESSTITLAWTLFLTA